MGAISREALHDALKDAWSADTSASSDWTEQNRAKGQCAVTACVVQDYLGGEILNTVATLPGGKTVSHYFNLIDGKNVDLTDEQFPSGTTFTEPKPKHGKYASTRDYCLSNDHTNQRYEVLRVRVAERMR
ncbi:hypothetical protein [Nocardia sp. NPDC127526]|uniref:YunG family protein n=1 Tax=Nocardia sp. NPDC127526 TaxID=3345393 RepID=UPI0036364620